MTESPEWIQHMYADHPLLHYDTARYRLAVKKTHGVWSWHIERRRGQPGSDIVRFGRGRYNLVKSAQAAALAALAELERA